MIEKERLQKALARAGHGSRREIEGWIEAGRIQVNNQVAKLGDRVSVEDSIKIDGHQATIKSIDELICRVLIYHKPEGEVCSKNDPEGRALVFDRLPIARGFRWINVGRLDINTSGLLLFTSDGELANRLMHPSHEVVREYAVRTFGEVSQRAIQNLRQGVMLEDGMANFDSIKDAGGEGINKWWHVSLKEGKNREIRRLWETQDIQISRLIRTRYGSIYLPKTLPRGGWLELPLEDVNSLLNLVGMKPETRSKLNMDKSSVKRSKLRSSTLKRTINKQKKRR